MNTGLSMDCTCNWWERNDYWEHCIRNNGLRGQNTGCQTALVTPQKWLLDARNRYFWSTLPNCPTGGPADGCQPPKQCLRPPEKFDLSVQAIWGCGGTAWGVYITEKWPEPQEQAPYGLLLWVIGRSVNRAGENYLSALPPIIFKLWDRVK